ncbi:hypothetical protein U169_01939 [Staphylococcus aureus W41918]|uniref:hypothetical protein n=1 Tax=Staphylococcus aureus TaxID=1280 RepID=UPI0004452401|nr:hypothetical protein [Staphylococcus aureus]EVV08051.1 hypothetical protein U169_01939 [Staphylococcus aureus W41918]EVW49565.1 hypothetical protein U233_01997 [Staphylococcus aureus M12717]EWK25129.1 hypothetical protein U586_02746 [Staphylococcus aureus T89463]
MKLLVTLKDGSKKHVSDLKKIVFPGYEGIETVTKEEIETFFLDPTKTYAFVGSQTLSVEAGQILTVEFS